MKTSPQKDNNNNNNNNREEEEEEEEPDVAHLQSADWVETWNGPSLARRWR